MSELIIEEGVKQGRRMTDHECKMIGTIQSLVSDMRSHLEYSKQETEALHKIIAKFDEAINGNGKPGLKTRMTMLEKSEEARNKLLTITWAAVITGAANAIYSVWSHVHKG